MPSASRCSARIASNARSIDGMRLANSYPRGGRPADHSRALHELESWLRPTWSVHVQPSVRADRAWRGPIANRLVVAPMCQYSASDGSATDWHLQHLSQLAYSGAGLVVVEATGVERRGRITHASISALYSDDNEAAFERVLHAARRLGGPTRFGIQLAHAGRKASSHRPWQGGAPLGPAEDPWQTDIVERHRVRRGLARAACTHGRRDRHDSGGVRAGSAARSAYRIRGDRNSQRARLSAARVPVAAGEHTHRRLRWVACQPPAPAAQCYS